jgi:hypothetical protein
MKNPFNPAMNNYPTQSTMNKDDMVLIKLGGHKKYERIVEKINYYQKWYNDMAPEERNSEIGIWVRNNIKMFDDIINKNL